jgi:hypothetical protein
MSSAADYDPTYDPTNQAFGDVGGRGSYDSGSGGGGGGGGGLNLGKLAKMLIPGLVGGASGVNQAQNNTAALAEQKRVQALVDAWAAKYAAYQGTVKDALGGSSLFGPKVTRTTSSGTSTMTPTYTPQTQDVIDKILKTYRDRLTPGVDPLGQGYETTAVKNVSDSFRQAKEDEANSLAARGIPPGSALLNSPARLAEASTIANTRAKLPLLRRQLNTEDLGGAQKASEMERGSAGTMTSDSTTTGPPDWAAILGYYGMQAPKEPPIVGRPALGSPLATGLGSGFDIYALLQKLYGTNA